MNRYGGLVVIDGAGNVRSAMWDFIEFDGLPQQMDAPVQNLLRAVSKAKVNGVFLSSLPNWGTAVTGDWHHFAVTPPASILHKRSVLTAGQRMAELREDFQMLRRGLDEYSADTFNQAVAVLQGNTLYRSDKFLGIAQSLAALKTLTAIPINKQSARALMWRAVAMLPAGACHIKSSMIGTLLDDLQAGLPAQRGDRAGGQARHRAVVVGQCGPGGDAGVEQPGEHHYYDVFNHSLECLNVLDAIASPVAVDDGTGTLAMREILETQRKHIGDGIARACEQGRAEHIGVIFQMFNLLPYGSVVDNGDGGSNSATGGTKNTTTTRAGSTTTTDDDSGATTTTKPGGTTSSTTTSVASATTILRSASSQKVDTSDTVIAGTTSWRSAITAWSAFVTMFASPSVLMARMCLLAIAPTQCCTAPLMPHAM